MAKGSRKSDPTPATPLRPRMGILTGGGDCPGLNAVIRAAVKTALNTGWDIYGIREGFAGLLAPEAAVCPLGSEDGKGILNMGGTILGTTNRGHPFAFPVKEGKGWVEKDRSDEALANFNTLCLDALIVIGGDGTLKIARRFFEKGLPVIGVPKTIDNDIAATVITFDRLLATRFGSAAVRLAREGFFGQMVALDPPHIKSVPLEDALDRMNRVPLTSEVIRAARNMGISFGEA